MYSFSIRQFIWEYVGILIRQFSISFRCLFLESNTNTKEKHLKNHWKPMNKNNDKQRTTHEHYWEPKKNLWTNQGKNQWKPQKNQWKNQRRNNEKQWKKKQFCQHSKLPFASDFWSLFFRCFLCLMGKEIRDNFEGKKETSLEVSWILYVHKTL